MNQLSMVRMVEHHHFWRLIDFALVSRNLTGRLRLIDAIIDWPTVGQFECKLMGNKMDWEKLSRMASSG